MTPAPRVSVVIASHDHASLLPAAIDSVLAQTIADVVEIVVVDDGSSDGTAALVRTRYGARVTCVVQEQRGLPAARNAGLARARGDAVLFLDADDALTADSIERRLAVLDARPDVGWVYCDLYFTDTAGEVTGRSAEVLGYARRRLEGRLFAGLLGGNFIPVHAVLVRRACLDAVGVFDETLRLGKEDWELWVRVAHRFSAAYLDAPLGYYRRSPGGMTSRRPAMALATLQAMARIEARFPRDVAAAAGWRRLRADQCLRLAASGAPELGWRDRLRWIARAIAVRPVQGAAYRALAHLVLGRREA